MGSTDIAAQEGHLKAFTVDATGLPSGSAVWDAATRLALLSANVRKNRLYSTNIGNAKVTFPTLDAAAFNMANATAITTLKNTLYTATLASLSPKSNLALINNEMDTLSYLDDANYRTYYNDTVSVRTKRVLASSDDGFLYAFDQDDGDLGWAWMPRSLVKELQNGASTFKDQHTMQGSIDVLDLKDSSTTYKSYIVGSYKQGLGQYVLRLSNNTSSDLDDVIWDVDLSASKSSTPNNGKRTYFKDGAGTVYSTSIATGNSANSSTLYIRSLTSNTTQLAIPLSFNASSTPYIRVDVGSTRTKSVYLGDDAGNIYSAVLLQTNGTLQTAGAIQTALGTAITALNTAPSEAVRYIGSARSSSDNTYYLRAQSENRLTVFKYESGSWVRAWTSYTGGGHKWTGGSTVAVDAAITSLPIGAKITDNAFIVADSIVLPVMHESTTASCFGASYYYFYKLTDGHFPVKTFYRGNTGITDELDLALGTGETRTLHLTNLIGSDKMLGLGMSDQTATAAGVGINGSFTIIDPFTTGIRSWRELRN